MIKKCYKCDKIATWCLISFSDYTSENINGAWIEKPRTDGFTGYACDEHVFRGCSCNQYQVEITVEGMKYPTLPEGVEGLDWHWMVQNELWEKLDGKGLKLPCCEWVYEKEGFDD